MLGTNHKSDGVFQNPHKYKIKKNQKYYYGIKRPKIHKYSQNFVDFIVEKIQTYPDILKKVRESYSRWQKKRRGNSIRTIK